MLCMQSRIHGLLLLTATGITVTLISRQSSHDLRAANAEEITWGATDPTWSPGGTCLAFSLFGSIWQVPSKGGIAEQISTGPGYHAHPSWSPHGDQIAFISGDPPSGAKATVSGKLMLLDPSTGQEREFATPYRVAGTLAWSPNATRIVCGLSVPDAGSLLHEM